MTGYRMLLYLALIPQFFSCSFAPEVEKDPGDPDQFVVVLGNVQDAGYPHIGCARACCISARKEGRRGKVSSIGFVDRASGSRYIFDATPDISSQLEHLNQWKPDSGKIVDGVFLTHAHVGHYTGLMYFGREALGADKIDVFAMPRMDTFIRENGPWDQLLRLENIHLKPLSESTKINLPGGLSVTPLNVPHRDEYSETVAFLIESKTRSLLYLPDIDKWNKWDQDILKWVRKCNYVLIDGTFYQDGEIKNRSMDEIPHPFVSETMHLMKDLSTDLKSKVFFIHFNHTNPILNPSEGAQREIKQMGFNSADEGMILSMD